MGAAGSLYNLKRDKTLQMAFAKLGIVQNVQHKDSVHLISKEKLLNGLILPNNPLTGMSGLIASDMDAPAPVGIVKIDHTLVAVDLSLKAIGRSDLCPEDILTTIGDTGRALIRSPRGVYE